MHKNDSPAHLPVLLQETLELLNPQEGELVVDGTLGLAGHSSEMLKRVGPEGFLYAFDLDERNIVVARPRLEAVGKNFRIIHDSFRSLTDRLKREGASQVDAVLFDLGLSSPHIDNADRGFSFLQEGPLDMRFDASEGKTAADILQKASEEELANIFYRYGEIHSSRKLARHIAEARRETPLTTTTQLAALVTDCLGKTRCAQAFQALRIAVNEELEALELGLSQALELLAPNGRVGVISYHSLEDRFVKQTFKQLSTDLRDPNDPFGQRVLRSKSLSLLTKKPITASPEEIAANPRARSAKLRVAQKL